MFAESVFLEGVYKFTTKCLNIWKGLNIYLRQYMFRLIFAGISLYVWIDTNYKEIPQMGDTESLEFWMSLLDVTFGCILRTLLSNVTFAH